VNVIIRLPDHWSPEKATILYDFVNELQDAIWAHYGERICEFMDQENQAEAQETLTEEPL